MLSLYSFYNLKRWHSYTTLLFKLEEELRTSYQLSKPEVNKKLCECSFKS